MRIGSAGTLESSDALVTVTEGVGITIRIDSVVDAFFHERILTAIRTELDLLGVKDAAVTVKDKGALDCTLRARVRTAVRRME